MSTNGTNITEDSEMAECDGDKVVTMVDVLQEEQDFEEDANAVLGASDDKNCTYAKGYIKRQAIYACLTCCPDVKEDPTKRAGVCLACSLTCHENHELIELYTKRNFRCDCGNPKFKFHPCQFNPPKLDLNEENKYNQNFSGLYCVCHRPYPDPEASCEDDMIQCIICEDWLHSSHLEASVPLNDQYAEMICKACMEKNDFLHDYSEITVNFEMGDVDVLTGNSQTISVYNGDSAQKVLINDQLSTDARDDKVIIKMHTDVEISEDKLEHNNSKEYNSEQEKSTRTAIEPTVNENDTDIDINASKVKESIVNDASSNFVQEENLDKEIKKTECISDDKISDICNQNPTVELTDQNKPITRLTDDSQQNETKQKKQTLTQKSVDDSETTKTSNNNGALPLENATAEKGGISETENDLLQNTSEIDNIKSSELLTTENQMQIGQENITEAPAEISSIEKSKLNPDEKAPVSNQQDQTNAEQVTEFTSDEALKTESEPNKIAELVQTTYETETPCPEKVDSKVNSENKEDNITAVHKRINTDMKNGSESVVEKADQQLLDDINAISEESTCQKDSDKTYDERTVDDQPKEDTELTKQELEIGNNEPETLVRETAVDINDTEKKKLMDTGVTISVDKDIDKTDAVMSAIDEILEGSGNQTTCPGKHEKNCEKTDSIITENDEMCIANKPVEVTEEMKTSNSAVEDVEMPFEEAIPRKSNVGNESIDIKETEPTVNNKSKAQQDAQSLLPETIDNTKLTVPLSLTENSIELADNKGNDAIPEDSVNENKRKLDTDLEAVLFKKAKFDERKQCSRPRNVNKVFKGATFWPSSFRQRLCTCGDCIFMYKDLNVLFLTDNEDTVTAYESLGKENVGISQYEKGLEALSSLDRIQQINALTEYNKMRDKLLDFLKSFKDRKEIVKEEDIKAFFAGMKPKREPDGVYFCR